MAREVMQAMVADTSIISRMTNLFRRRSHCGRTKICNIPVPTIEDDQILVRVKWLALNPSDFKHIDLLSPKGAIIGCDYCGEVAQIGSQAPGNWKIGDRVAGVTHGGLFPDRGSFAEYLSTPGNLAWKVPSEITDEQAATLGVSAVTAMLALNMRLGLPWKIDKDVQKQHDPSILIYSGSSSTGLYAIQIAKLAGYRVVATASPHSHELVKSYGADDVFDYHSPDLVKLITRLYPNIEKALDCFSEGDSTELCTTIIGKNGGKVVTLLNSGGKDISGVETVFLLAYTVFNKDFQWIPPFGPRFKGSLADKNALIRFFSALPELSKTRKTPPLQVIDGGFGGLSTGLNLLRDRKVSGKKLVVNLF